MEKYVLTKETLLAARDYVPLAEKEAWVDEAAAACVDALKISGEAGAMPDMYMANAGRKSRWLMGALTGLYLPLRGKDETGALSAEDYDRYAGSHLLNQIERWKSDAETRNKCFDLLSDFRDLEKRLNGQLIALLGVQNDSVVRQSLALSEEMAKLPAALKTLEETQRRQG